MPRRLLRSRAPRGPSVPAPGTFRGRSYHFRPGVPVARPDAGFAAYFARGLSGACTTLSAVDAGAALPLCDCGMSMRPRT